MRQLAESLQAGATLPPIVVERETSRVVDGFHRVEAHRRVYGREAMIEVIEKEYASEGEPSRALFPSWSCAVDREACRLPAVRVG